MSDNGPQPGLHMKRLFILALPAVLISTPALAEVDPKIHKLCIEAKDYAGCVRAMKGETSPVGGTRLRLGLQDELGNACPPDYAYSGNGKCRAIRCIPMGIWGSNEPQLAGKGHTCEGRYDLPGAIYKGRASMRWGSQYTNAMIDPSCPNIEPKIGSLNSCGLEAQFKELEAKKSEAARQKLLNSCDFKIREYACSYDAYLDANPAIQEWAELNPEMAAKERARLQSVD